jgi:hypothetical protein
MYKGVTFFSKRKTQTQLCAKLFFVQVLQNYDQISPLKFLKAPLKTFFSKRKSQTQLCASVVEPVTIFYGSGSGSDF